MTDPLIKAIGLFPELAGETVPEQVQLLHASAARIPAVFR